MMPDTRSAEKVTVAPRSLGKYIAQIAIVFGVQFGAGKLAEALPAINSGGVGPVWPAAGVALAALLVCGYQVWPGVAAGAFLLTLLSPITPVAAFLYAIGSTLAALTGAFLLRRVMNFDLSLSRLRDALGLIVLGAFGSSIVSAFLGVAVLYSVNLHGWSGIDRAWLIYWLGDSMGVLLVTPFVLTLPGLLKIRSRVRIAELAALLLLLTVACFIIFGDLTPVSIKLHVLAFAVLPFVMWAAIRFGVSGAALSTLIIAIIATTETAVGSGPFAQGTPFANAVLLDVFFAVLSVSGMTLGAVIVERERAQREREQLVREQAMSEVRLRLATIVESSHDAIMAADMDGLVTDWNDAAAQLYGYSAREIIGKSVSLFIPPDRTNELAEMMEAWKRGDTVKSFETVRLSRDGTRIDVSLTASPMKDTEGKIVGASVIVRDVSESKRQETLLRESEERLRVAAEVGRMYAWEWDPATDLVRRSAECASILGFSEGAGEGIANDYFSSIHPDDRSRLWSLVDSLTTENRVYRTQYRKFRPDGALLWLEESAYAKFDGDGKMVRLVGMTADITERKRAEDALEAQKSRLIEAQEQERTRIARELHDDIGQRLALLTNGLEQLRHDSPDLPADVCSRMGKLLQQSLEIATDIQSLSHELHSSKLAVLGLAATMRGFCREFGDHENVEIDVETHDLPSTLPPTIALCLFRVLQEALRNSAKHSGVRHFEVRSWGTRDEVHLTVKDSGAGFELEAARYCQGLGLISMEERIKLLKGTLSIDSQPRRGTTIHARVPLSSGSDSIRTAV
jgi:PAS domain S-box-containing protein